MADSGRRKVDECNYFSDCPGLQVYGNAFYLGLEMNTLWEKSPKFFMWAMARMVTMATDGESYVMYAQFIFYFHFLEKANKMTFTISPLTMKNPECVSCCDLLRVTH